MEIRYVGDGYVQVFSGTSDVARENPDYFNLRSEQDRQLFLLITHYDTVLRNTWIESESRSQRERVEYAMERVEELREKASEYKSSIKGKWDDSEFSLEMAEALQDLDAKMLPEYYSDMQENPGAYIAELIADRRQKIPLPADLVAPVPLGDPLLYKATLDQMKEKQRQMEEQKKPKIERIIARLEKLIKTLVPETDPDTLIPDWGPYWRAQNLRTDRE